MKKILLVDLNPTVPLYTAYYANALEKKYKVSILGKRKYDETKKIPNLKFLKVLNLEKKFKKGNPILKYIDYRMNFFKLLFIANKFDAIHIQWLPMISKSLIDLYLIKFLLKNKKVVYTVHNIFPHNNINKCVEKRYKKLYETLPILCVHSKESKIKLEKLLTIKKKINITPHGPLLEDKIKYSSMSKQISVIGTISEYKGIEDTIIALDILKTKGYNLTLLIAGKGEKSYIEKLEALIQEKNLDKNVIREYRYLMQEEIIKYHEESLLTLATYKKIEQSGAVITSLSLGVPVVAYDIGGLREIIKDEMNGKIIRERNIDKLVDGIIWICENSSDELSKNCKDIIEQSSWIKTVEIMEGIY